VEGKTAKTDGKSVGRVAYFILLAKEMGSLPRAQERGIRKNSPILGDAITERYWGTQEVGGPKGDF